jgi:hypothetical protein
MRQTLPFLVLLLAAGVALAVDEPAVESTEVSVDDAEGKPGARAEDEPESAKAGPKTLSGMSVLGNRETPKALVIVPWKSSQIGDSLGISAMLDEGRQPVDRDVFLRALRYYEIRSEGNPPPDIPARRGR